MTTLHFAGTAPKDRLLVEKCSGAVPLLWQRSVAWHQTIKPLPGKVRVEASGTIRPSEFTRDRVAHFNASPKIGHLVAVLVRGTASGWARFGVEEQ